MIPTKKQTNVKRLGGATGQGHQHARSMMARDQWTGARDTSDMPEKGNDEIHRRHLELAQPSGWDGLRERKSWAVTDGLSILHFNELFQITQGLLHSWIDITQ